MVGLVKRLLVASAVLFALAISSTAQGDQKDKKTFEVRANVLILNEKNEYVNDVKASDIKLFEADVEQKLTSVTTISGATDMILLVDNTGSVRTQLDDIIAIAKIVVANLRPADRAELIRFVGRDHIEIEQLWTNNQADLTGALDLLFVEGGESAVVDALYLATEDIIKRQQAVKDKRYAVVLISDAEDRNSYYSEKDLFKLLENSPVQIFTIALTKELPKSLWDAPGNRKTVGSVVKFANRLAAKTGGASYILREKSTPNDRTAALKALLIELRSQYVITYTAADVTKENNVRKLSVTVANGPNGEIRKGLIKDTVVLPVK